MTRYYFHVRSPTGREVDTEGLEFATLEAAVADAERAGREMVLDEANNGSLRVAHNVFEIMDLAGNLLREVPFLPPEAKNGPAS